MGSSSSSPARKNGGNEGNVGSVSHSGGGGVGDTSARSAPRPACSSESALAASVGTDAHPGGLAGKLEGPGTGAEDVTVSVESGGIGGSDVPGGSVLAGSGSSDLASGGGTGGSGIADKSEDEVHVETEAERQERMREMQRQATLAYTRSRDKQSVNGLSGDVPDFAGLARPDLYWEYDGFGHISSAIAGDAQHSVSCCDVRGGVKVDGWNGYGTLDEIWMGLTWLGAVTSVLDWRPTDCDSDRVAKNLKAPLTPRAPSFIWTDDVRAGGTVQIHASMVHHAYPWEGSDTRLARVSRTAMAIVDIHNSGREVLPRIVVDLHKFAFQLLQETESLLSVAASLHHQGAAAASTRSGEALDRLQSALRHLPSVDYYQQEIESLRRALTLSIVETAPFLREAYSTLFKDDPVAVFEGDVVGDGSSDGGDAGCGVAPAPDGVDSPSDEIDEPSMAGEAAPPNDVDSSTA